MEPIITPKVPSVYPNLQYFILKYLKVKSITWKPSSARGRTG